MKLDWSFSRYVAFRYFPVKLFDYAIFGQNKTNMLVGRHHMLVLGTAVIDIGQNFSEIAYMMREMCFYKQLHQYHVLAKKVQIAIVRVQFTSNIDCLVGWLVGWFVGLFIGWFVSLLVFTAVHAQVCLLFVFVNSWFGCHYLCSQNLTKVLDFVSWTNWTPLLLWRRLWIFCLHFVSRLKPLALSFRYCAKDDLIDMILFKN